MTDDLRELDQRCAEAMGYAKDEWGCYTPAGERLSDEDYEQGRWFWEPPHYSTSIAHAWTLVEFMRERGWDFYVGGNKRWEAEFWKPPLTHTREADTAPLAIARAFLAAMEAK